MTMRKCSIFYLAFLLCGMVGTAHPADVPAEPWVHKIIFGLVLHDRGLFSDRHESGVDPNAELQFYPPKWPPWQWLGSPNPTAGLTPNFNGDTSVFYAGLNYELSLSNRWTDELTGNLTRDLFIGASLSAARHTGPLHKNSMGCKERSDCGFGYRVLPRLGFEVGTDFAGRHALSIFYDHMSHKGILPGENEGIDHIGIRYHLLFGKR
jgi:hypothetical protein